MGMIKNAFKAVDTYMDTPANREKVLIGAIIVIAAASILRR